MYSVAQMFLDELKKSRNGSYLPLSGIRKRPVGFFYQKIGMNPKGHLPVLVELDVLIGEQEESIFLSKLLVFFNDSAKALYFYLWT